MDSDKCFAVAQDRRDDVCHETRKEACNRDYLQQQVNTEELLTQGCKDTRTVASLSSGKTVDRLSHLSMCCTNSETYDGVLKNIKSSLPEHWICIPFEKRFHIMLLSRGNLKAVQRQIVIHLDGKVTLFVHCKLIPSHKVSQFITCDNCDTMTLLSPNHVEKYSAWVCNIVNRVRLMDICTGMTNEEFKSLWDMDTHGYIDNNPYQESRYLLTYRSHECVKLVLPRKQKCTPCSRLRDILKRRAGIHAKGIKLCTSNIYLTEEEKLRKLKEQQVQLKRMKSKLVWLRKKVDSLAEAHGIDKELEDMILDIAFSNISHSELQGVS